MKASKVYRQRIMNLTESRSLSQDWEQGKPKVSPIRHHRTLPPSFLELAALGISGSEGIRKQMNAVHTTVSECHPYFDLEQSPSNASS